MVPHVDGEWLESENDQDAKHILITLTQGLHFVVKYGRLLTSAVPYRGHTGMPEAMIWTVLTSNKSSQQK